MSTQTDETEVIEVPHIKVKVEDFESLHRAFRYIEKSALTIYEGNLPVSDMRALAEFAAVYKLRMQRLMTELGG